MSRKEKTEDLKNMLNSFRIAELQTLLATCGRSRSGRKHELLGRAMSLLKSSEGSPMRERVKTRILELYHQRCPPGSSYQGGSSSSRGEASHNNSSSSDTTYRPSFMTYSSETENSYLNRPRPNFSMKSQSSSRSINYHPVNQSHNNSLMYEQSSIHAASAMPVHPDVRFIGLPFYEVLDTLIKPTSLAQKTMTGYQTTDLVYHFTPHQSTTISKSRSFNIKSMIEYSVQVHLRFCLAETSCVQEDLYPPRCKVIVNNKAITLPGQPPPNAQNQEPRKPHRPVNITSFCELSPMKGNQITIQWMPSELGQRHAATIQIVKAVQTETLINKLQQKTERSSEHTIAFIKEKLKPDPDSEIALTSLKVSLCCPIGRTRMKIPCRANNCNHLQCFDGSLYIQMNERKPSWVCPVCDQKSHYDQLFKDGLFAKIIEKTPDCDEIVFFNDGSWRTLSEVQESAKSSQNISTPQPKKPSAVLDCKTPPPPLIPSNTPPTLSMCSPNTRPDTPPITMPQLEQLPPKLTKTSPSISNEPEKDDVEVICIDDSDSEDGVPPLQAPAITDINHVANAWNSLNENAHHSSSSLHPDLQGLDLYNLLPHEDRIAAAMYLERTGLMSQLSSNSNPRSSPSVIDISDE